VDSVVSFASTTHQGLRQKASSLLEKAKRNHIIIATAESCTAGQLVSLLAAQPSAADVVAGGFVVYSKAAKAAILGVPVRLIRRCTAVSAEVAKSMARGALRRANCTIAIAVTGVAGPTPDEDENPVGLVYIATASHFRVKCNRWQLRGKAPARNLLQMHRFALAMLEEAVRSR
jgi:nicotinamide-nucleotide amidase